jgi:Leucine rich repeat
MNCYSFILVVLIIVSSADSFGQLDEKCSKLGCDQCSTTSLICNSGKLKTFPNVPQNIYRALNIAYQFFTDPTLHKMLFRNFQMLTELKVTFTNINRIESFTFQNLPNLNYLYLNNNRLGIVSAYSFYDLLIEHLYLDDNPYLNLDYRAFVGLRVQGVSLTHCNLLTVNFETFEPLFDKLQMLTLTDNFIERLDVKFEKPFSHF